MYCHWHHLVRGLWLFGVGEMRLTKQLKRKDYVVLGWTQDKVLMQSLVPPYNIIEKPRTKVYGLKKGN